MPVAKPILKPNPRRLLLFAALCVVLGLTTSVGVAWSVAWTIPIPLVMPDQFGRSAVVIEDGGKQWAWHAMRDHSTRQGAGRGLDIIMINATTDESNNPTRRRAWFEKNINDPASLAAMARHEPYITTMRSDAYIGIIQAGWPRLCLAYEDAWQGISGDKHFGRTVAAPFGRIIDTSTGLLPYYNALEVGDHPLPLRPLWPGLLANTAIYGGAWASIIGGPILLRRWLRSRKGGCVQCGYSREGLKPDAPCPECGHVSTATPTAATPQSPLV